MAKVEIHVPNKSYDGIYGGVRFAKGVGIFEDVEKAKVLAERYGYELVTVGEEKQVEVVEVEAEKVEKPAPKKRTRKPKVGE